MKKQNRGGVRINAGAKPKYNEPTKTIAFRCPESKVNEIKDMVKSKLDLWKLVLILFISISYGQEHYLYTSAAIDIRNATLGSEPTNYQPELNYLLQAGIVSRNIEVNIGYERFETIKFDKMTMGVGYHFPFYSKWGKTILIPSIEPTIINRWGNEWGSRSSHLSIGGNLSLRWNLSDTIAFELLCNALPRTDLATRYDDNKIVISNFAKVIFKFNR